MVRVDSVVEEAGKMRGSRISRNSGGGPGAEGRESDERGGGRVQGSIEWEEEDKEEDTVERDLMMRVMREEIFEERRRKLVERDGGGGKEEEGEKTEEVMEELQGLDAEIRRL